MLGMVQLEQGKGKWRLERGQVGPLETVTATLFLPERLSERRARRKVRRLAGELRRLGVRRIIVGADGPWAEELSCFRRVDTAGFYRNVADVLALGCIMCKGKEPAREKVALAGARLCPELAAAAERLCPQVRGLSIQTPGGEALAGWLHRRYGMPLWTPEGAAVTAAFSPVEKHWGVELPLYEGGKLPDGLRLETAGLDLPEQFAPELLCALWERGALSRESLYVTQWGQKPERRGEILLTN